MILTLLDYVTLEKSYSTNTATILVTGKSAATESIKLIMKYQHVITMWSNYFKDYVSLYLKLPNLDRRKTYEHRFDCC